MLPCSQAHVWVKKKEPGTHCAHAQFFQNNADSYCQSYSVSDFKIHEGVSQAV